MTFTVVTLPEAESDFESLYQYIAERSLQGANSWANAFNAAFEKLKTNPRIYSLAPESADVEEDVFQLIVKTTQGNPYRILFSIRETTVFIWAIRGFHQDYAYDLSDIKLP